MELMRAVRNPRAARLFLATAALKGVCVTIRGQIVQAEALSDIDALALAAWLIDEMRKADRIRRLEAKHRVRIH